MLNLRNLQKNPGGFNFGGKRRNMTLHSETLRSPLAESCLRRAAGGGLCWGCCDLWLSNYSHAFASNKTASRKQGCLFNCNQICRLRSAPPSPAQEPRAARREEAQSRADPLHNGGRAGHWAWPHRASRSPGSISSAGGPASSARDGGAGGAEGEAWARTPSHTHADVPRFAWFLLLRGRGSTVLRSHRRAGVGGARVRGAPTSGSGTGRAAG